MSFASFIAWLYLDRAIYQSISLSGVLLCLSFLRALLDSFRSLVRSLVHQRFERSVTFSLGAEASKAPVIAAVSLSARRSSWGLNGVSGRESK